MVSSLRRRLHSLLPLALLLAALGAIACQSDEEKMAAFNERGTAYMENQQWAEAVIEFRNVLQIDPNDAQAHERLAEAYLKLQKYKESYWELSESVRLDPSNIDVRLAYAGISVAAERYEEVLEQCDAILELDPDHAAAHLLRGQALMNLEREDEVEEALLRALALEPDSGPYEQVVSSYYKQTGDLEKAESHLLRAIELQPSVTNLTAMARMLTEQGERDEEAERYFELAIEKSRDPADIDGDNPMLGAYNNLAAFYFMRGRDEEGVAALERGIEEVENKKQDLIQLLARYYRSQGEADKADALLEQAAAADPTNPLPYLTVSSAKSRRGDMVGALEAADMAVAADPLYVPARLRRAELLIDLGNRESDEAKVAEGRAIVDSVLTEDPQNSDGLFVLSKVQIATGDHVSAIESLRACLDGRPNWPQAHFVLGSALMLNGELQRARAELARAVELDPNLLDARRLLIRLHSDLGEYEYAIENGETYLARRPEDDQIRIMVAQSLVRLRKIDEASKMLEAIPEERRGVEAYYAIGRVRLAKGQIEEGRALLLKASELRPNNARLLGALLAADREQGKLSHSIKRINDAVEAEPEDASLWQLKGMAARISGDSVGAEKAFKKAIELDSGALEAYKQLALLYQSEGRVKETVDLYEAAVAAHPDSAPSRHFLGILYEMSGRLDEARKQYETVLELDPNMAETKNNLAYLLADSGEELDRALKLAQEAKAAMPDSPNAADTLGWVLYKRGVSSAAIGYLREAIQIAKPDNPGLGEIRTHLSLAYEATGETDKAIETLETALAHLEELRASGKIKEDPDWAARARENIERLKAAS